MAGIGGAVNRIVPSKRAMIKQTVHVAVGHCVAVTGGPTCTIWLASGDVGDFMFALSARLPVLQLPGVGSVASGTICARHRFNKLRLAWLFL